MKGSRLDRESKQRMFEWYRFADGSRIVEFSQEGKEKPKKFGLVGIKRMRLQCVQLRLVLSLSEVASITE